MALHSINVSIVLTEINCGECGGTYAINERYREQQYQKGGTWTCPYCKTGWGYSNNNENAKLKARVDDLTRARDSALARANENQQALDKANRKIKQHQKRAASGTCPCCKRTFQQLARHMTAKHPGYGA